MFTVLWPELEENAVMKTENGDSPSKSMMNAVFCSRYQKRKSQTKRKWKDRSYGKEEEALKEKLKAVIMNFRMAARPRLDGKSPMEISNGKK